MVTTIGKEARLTDLIENLLYLEHDAVAAYEEAVTRIDDGGFKSSLQGFQRDHQRHITDLSSLMRDLGGTPPGGGDFKQMLTTGKVKMADFFGDKAILQAMKTNEDDTNTAYERAAAHGEATPAARTLFEGCLADERRHRAWIEETVARL
ncbi:MAG: ferritin-like domain-containing protein [Caenispirillum bisanense]|nr:ferritin-like domain-containing protein [Caenispirillum bisanense]MCA1973301.1 ferritin-like domain-containing protein [Caenispirillum sp.]